MIRGLVVATVLACSGCLSIAVQENTALPDETRGFISDFMFLSDCSGIQAEQAYPPGISPAPTPSGWDPDPESDTVIRFFVWRCAQVGLHELERSATIAIETGTNGYAPKNCTLGSSVRPSYLLNFLTDDMDLAHILDFEFGINAKIASFNYEINGTIKNIGWVVGEIGSEIEVIGDQPGQVKTEEEKRIVWETDSGMSYVDLDISYQNPYLYYQSSRGFLNEPHYIGPLGIFAGVASFDSNGKILGEMHRSEGVCD